MCIRDRYLYILNLAMVSTDAILWVRNRKLEKRADAEKNREA